MPTPRKYSDDTDYLQSVFDEALEAEQSRVGGEGAYARARDAGVAQTLEDRSPTASVPVQRMPYELKQTDEDPREMWQPLSALVQRPQYPREAPPGMSLRGPSKEATGPRPAVPTEAPPGMGSAFYGRAARLARDDGDEGGAARYAVRAAEDDQQNTGHPAPQLPPVSPFAALARAPRQRAQSMYGGLGAPPERQAPSQAGNAIALALDALMNRGRNAGRIVSRLATPQDSEYENYQRRVQAAKDAASIEALGRRGLPREADPETMELRRAQAELARERFENSKAKDAAKAAAETAEAEEAARKSKLDSEETRSAQDVAISMGMPEQQARQLTAMQIEDWRPQIGTLSQQLRSNTEWRKRFAMSQGGRKEMLELSDEKHRERMGLAADIDADKAEKVAGRERAKEGRVAAREFEKESRDWRDVAYLIGEVERLAPEGSDMPGYGATGPLPEKMLSKEGVELRKTAADLYEAYARARTGAAISMTEDDRFALQTGFSPTSTDAQIRTAIGVLKKWSQSNLKAMSTGREGAARSVLENSGVDASFLPEGEFSAQPEAPRARRAAPAKRPAPRARAASDGEWETVGGDDDEWETVR